MVVCTTREKKRRSLQTGAFENDPSVRQDVNKTKTSQCCNVMCNISKVQIFSADHKILKDLHMLSTHYSAWTLFGPIEVKNIWFHNIHQNCPRLKISKMSLEVEQQFECNSNYSKNLIISNFSNSCLLKWSFSTQIKIEIVLMQGKILTKGKDCGKLVL